MQKLFPSLILLVTLISATAQEAVMIPKLNAEITLDGMPDEKVWEMAVPFKFTMHVPHFGNEPTEKTDARLFFTDKYLYAGVKLFYEDVSMMARSGKQRDYFSATCDWFGILLDTYDDNENAMLFYTNPNGLRWDATVKSDAAMAMQDLNINWNTFWDVETVIDDKGWYAEFRIPVSSLRFQVVEGMVEMGLSMMRYMPMKSESDLFPAIPPDWESAMWKPSVAAPVIFEGMVPDKALYIAPYILTGYDRAAVKNQSETAYEFDKTPQFEPGLDLKYGLTNNLTLDITINTDFAQVEADDQQINLTRLSLFFPEKRPFFLEKSDVFDFALGGGNNLFYSRRIGLYDGSPVRIFGGARVTGRAGKWDIGLMDMQTQAIDGMVSQNFGVLRTKRSVFNDNSYIGAMTTSILGTDGSYNLVYGLDGVIRLFGDDYFTVRWAQTFEEGTSNKLFSTDPSRLMVKWEKRKQRGFGYDLSYSWSGKSFNPGMGFELRDNYFGARIVARYGWVPDDAGTILRVHTLSQENMLWYNSDSFEPESFIYTTKWNFETRSGYSGFITVNRSVESVNDSIDFGDAQVPPGKYGFWYMGGMFNLSASLNPSGNILAEAGQFYDGTKYSATIMPLWRVSPGLDINTTYRLDIVKFKDRGQELVNHIVGLKALAMFSTKLSFITFVQYNTSVDAFIINGRFRYNPREGTDLYIVYNEGLNSNPEREIPILPRSNDRTIMLKYTHTFGF